MPFELISTLVTASPHSDVMVLRLALQANEKARFRYVIFTLIIRDAYVQRTENGTKDTFDGRRAWDGRPGQ